MHNVIHEGGAPIFAWTDGVPIEDAARKQLLNVAALPFIHHHVAAMPDVHWGMGATVGSVIPTRGAIVPAAVGVDIGCGMVAAKTVLNARDLPDTLAGVRAEIEKTVPHGRTNHGGEGDRGAWHDVPDAVAQLLGDFDSGDLGARLKLIADKHPKLAKPAQRAPRHLGTLGTGNHFVEVCLDEADAVWVMLHSGSRGIGNAIGQHFIEKAKEDMKRWFIALPDQDLAYLAEGSANFDDYVEAVAWAQEFAAANRSLMMKAAMAALMRALGRSFDWGAVAVNCHHNYVSREHHYGANVWLTRKGAVKAGKGDLGIIPGSMGAKSFIVRGLGNAQSFNTCSHGAGRAMSRAEAKRRFTVADHEKATAGVECRKDAEVIDETPMAYKDIDAVMAAQADLVEIVHTLRQVVCVKG
ncbi:MAG TPA: RtcB family protein [Rhizomicrobium sp.]|jgi:tRNA-splicing ligase RtcB|nr:RtcB family protein [Rhizomicrobium sp.]